MSSLFVQVDTDPESEEEEEAAYWAQMEAANMETIFGPETDKDHQLLLPYAQ